MDRVNGEGGRHDDQVDSMSQFLIFDLDKRLWVEREHDEFGRPLRGRFKKQLRTPAKMRI